MRGGYRLSYLKKKKSKEKGNKPPKGMDGSNLSATLIFFLTSNVEEVVCEASFLIFS